MEFRILTSRDKETFRDEMLAMMACSDKEFVPPISSRASTTQKTLTGAAATGDVTPYFTAMLEQEIIGVFEDGDLVGYLSYRLDFTSDVVSADTLPNLYLSTLITKPSARGKGLTARLYDHLFRVIFPDRNVYTRTWSTNGAHIHILSKFSFREISRVPNGRGNGIDTVYYERKKR